jgi:sialate O-acetylesterase
MGLMRHPKVSPLRLATISPPESSASGFRIRYGALQSYPSKIVSLFNGDIAMTKRSQAFALLLCCCFVSAASADVTLPRILGSSMVVQQKKPTQLWGWADAGEEVKVRFGEQAASTKTSDDGSWSLQLTPPEAGGPYEIVISGKNEITLKDVLVGEVWICSGQSNMQWSVQQALNPADEIAAAKYPNIRLFTVPRNPAEEPQKDTKGGNWTECNPKTAAGFSAVGYFFGRELHEELDVPVGLVNTSWGGTIADAWTSTPALEGKEIYKPILERAKVFKPGQPNQASALYNGMIAPLIPLSIQGAIWYQGESNVARAAQYAELFPTMITDWRTNWGQGDFPFVFVQLAPFRYGRHDAELLAELWDAQLHTLKTVDNVGMAVTTDIGNIRDIHPKNKQEVGRRLALWALVNSYGADIVYSGPIFKDVEFEGSNAIVSFDHIGSGLEAEGDLTYFTIAGEDGKFVEATAKIDGEKVIVSNDQVKDPSAVRFGWTDTAEPNLFNKEGLPASPFRTDDMKLKTEGNN